MGEIINFPSTSEITVADLPPSGFKIPDKDALYDDDQLIYEGKAASYLRRAFEDNGDEHALRSLENNLYYSRCQFIRLNAETSELRQKALIELAVHTHLAASNLNHYTLIASTRLDSVDLVGVAQAYTTIKEAVNKI